MDKGVTDMHCLVRPTLGCFEGGTKDQRSRLALSKLSTDEHLLEKRTKPRRFKFRPLHCRCTIREHTKREVASELLQERQHIWIWTTVTETALPVDVCGFSLHRRVMQTPGGKGLVPDCRQHSLW
jgi:hypothetical protein